jgi:hypothetical protein
MAPMIGIKMSFTNDFTVRRWKLHVLADWQNGSNILNLTTLLWDFGQLSPDYADPCGPPQCAAGETVGSHRLAGFQAVASNYLESASFLKLREVSLSYELPQRLAQSCERVRSWLSLSGRNL